MLAIYRRHLRGCPHRSKGRSYRRCRCPIWVDGRLGDADIRKSLGLRDWQKAQDLVRKWEAEGERRAEAPPVTIEQACEEFIRDAGARGLREPTLYKYGLLFRQLQQFSQENGLRLINQFDLDALRKFRASWPNRNMAAQKKLENLRAFFRFAHDSGWISTNAASSLKNPKNNAPPTMPFTREEVIRIFAACDRYPDNYGRTGGPAARRLQALVLLLRYSGLRIGDAVTLARERLVGNKLLLYTAKTGTPVYCPLPDCAVTALEAAPRTSERYFFWTGESTLKSVTRDWQRSLKKLFRLAGVPDGYAHRFRHTFAVDLLLAGVPLERVAVLLGHQSVRVTEKHYAPWVHARQAQLEADVKRVWDLDLPATKGTPQVRGKAATVN